MAARIGSGRREGENEGDFRVGVVLVLPADALRLLGLQAAVLVL